MNVHSAVERSVPAWKGWGMEEHLNAIGDFMVGVGGVLKGDSVAVVNPCNGVLSPALQQLGARVRMVEEPRFLSANALPLASGCTDVLFADMVLHHMRFPAQAIAEMKRVLRPGGRLVMTDLGKYNDAGLKAARKDRWMGFYTSDIRHWLHKTGFSNIIVNPVPFKVLGFDMACLNNGVGADLFMATGTAHIKGGWKG